MSKVGKLKPGDRFVFALDNGKESKVYQLRGFHKEYALAFDPLTGSEIKPYKNITVRKLEHGTQSQA